MTDYKGSKEENNHVNNNVAFATRSTREKTTKGSVPHDVLTGIPTDVSTSDDDSSVVKELTKEVLIESYIMMY